MAGQGAQHQPLRLPAPRCARAIRRLVQPDPRMRRLSAPHRKVRTPPHPNGPRPAPSPSCRPVGDVRLIYCYRIFADLVVKILLERPRGTGGTSRCVPACADGCRRPGWASPCSPARPRPRGPLLRTHTGARRRTHGRGTFASGRSPSIPVGGENDVRRRLCGPHVGRVHAGVVGGAWFACPRLYSAIGYSRDPVFRSWW